MGWGCGRALPSAQSDRIIVEDSESVPAGEFFEVLDLITETPWREQHIGYFADRKNAQRVADDGKTRNPRAESSFIRIHAFDDPIAGFFT